MQNDKIAEILDLYANLISLHGENNFKVNTYKNAVFNIKKKTPELLTNISTEQLYKMPQFGKSIADKIIEIIAQGSFSALDELLSITPKGVIEILKIRGLGPKKVQIIWQEMGITSIAELLDACRENRLALAKGFGEKTQQQVLDALQFSLNSEGLIHWAKAEKYTQLINKSLLTIITESDYHWVGQFCRKNAIISHLELIIDEDYKRSIIILLNNYDLIQDESNKNIYKCKIDNSLLFSIYFFERSNIAWQQYQLNTPLEIQNILKINQIDANSEQELFTKQNKPFIIAEVRETENKYWIEKPRNLIVQQDLKGCLHNHTTYSDGMNTLSEMAAACLALNLSYFGVCDHSKSAGYAGGMQLDKVFKQWDEIDVLNKKYSNFKIYKGIESDILADGSLDYENDVLGKFDFVVASIHSNLKMEEEKAMKRLIKAIEHPCTRILGHPTGRLLLMRDGYPIDHKKIIDACATNNVAIELNAHPYRLDIDWRYIDYCMQKGVLISINPDAHIIGGLTDMRYGINVARKGGLEKTYCLNTKSIEDFEKWLKEK